MIRSRLARGALVAVLAGAVALAACTGDDDSTTSEGADITISTFQFRPNPATVEGGTITVTNADSTTHTFTSGTPDAPDGTFSLRLTGPDATDSVAVDPGTYPYFCEIHTSMTGEVTVT